MAFIVAGQNTNSNASLSGGRAEWGKRCHHYFELHESPTVWVKKKGPTQVLMGIFLSYSFFSVFVLVLLYLLWLVGWPDGRQQWIIRASANILLSLINNGFSA